MAFPSVIEQLRIGYGYDPSRAPANRWEANLRLLELVDRALNEDSVVAKLELSTSSVVPDEFAFASCAETLREWFGPGDARPSGYSLGTANESCPFTYESATRELLGVCFDSEKGYVNPKPVSVNFFLGNAIGTGSRSMLDQNGMRADCIVPLPCTEVQLYACRSIGCSTATVETLRKTVVLKRRHRVVHAYEETVVSAFEHCWR